MSHYNGSHLTLIEGEIKEIVICMAFNLVLKSLFALLVS